MIKHKTFYTATMAKIHTDQGNFEKAAEVYRYLLQLEPGRQDFVEALKEVEDKYAPRKKKDSNNLVPLFNKWIALTLEYNRLQYLKKLKAYFLPDTPSPN